MLEEVMKELLHGEARGDGSAAECAEVIEVLLSMRK